MFMQAFAIYYSIIPWHSVSKLLGCKKSYGSRKGGLFYICKSSFHYSSIMQNYAKCTTLYYNLVLKEFIAILVNKVIFYTTLALYFAVLFYYNCSKN